MRSPSVLTMFTKADPDREWTPRDVAEFIGLGGFGPVLVGSPTTVADELERWVEEGGIDGFNFADAVTPGTFEDIVEYVAPERRRRGRVWDNYPDGTLRGRLNGTGEATIQPWHPAAKYRGAYTNAPSVAGLACTDVAVPVTSWLFWIATLVMPVGR